MCVDCNNNITLPTGPKGDTGDTGPAGATGATGAPGSTYRYISMPCLAKSQDHAVATNVSANVFELPFNATLQLIGAYVDVAGITGVATIDVNKNGTSILSTRITIDTTEKTSRTAVTQPVISVSSFLVGDLITVDIDTIQSTAAKGLTVRMKFLEV